jgi:hypothetical protein
VTVPPCAGIDREGVGNLAGSCLAGGTRDRGSLFQRRRATVQQVIRWLMEPARTRNLGEAEYVAESGRG